MGAPQKLLVVITLAQNCRAAMPFVRTSAIYDEESCCECFYDRIWNGFVLLCTFPAYLSGILLHAVMRTYGLPLPLRVFVYLSLMVPGSFLVFRSWKLRKDTSGDHAKPGLFGLMAFTCGLASLVVGIIIDAFCVPNYGTTECHDEFDEQPFWVFSLLGFPVLGCSAFALGMTCHCVGRLFGLNGELHIPENRA